MLRTLLGFSLLISLFGSAIPIQPAHAQSDCIQVGYGDFINGFIDSLEVTDRFEDVYCFYGNAGDTVTIDMVAEFGDIDPLLIVQSSDGTVVAENDDRGDGTINSRINLTLTTTDWHFIRASQYPYGEAVTSGDYSLSITAQVPTSGNDSGGDDSNTAQPTATEATITVVDNCATRDAQGITAITPLTLFNVWDDGGPVDSAPSFADSSGRIFCFDAFANDMVVAQVITTASNVDTFMTLSDSDGNVLAENDNNAYPYGDASIDSYIEYVVPSDGTYFLNVSTVDGSAGEVTVELSKGNWASMMFCRYVENGTEYNGILNDSGLPVNVATHCVYAQEGDMLQATAVGRSGNLDTYITLQYPNQPETDSEVSILDSADDIAADVDNAAQINYEIPADGLYMISVMQSPNTPLEEGTLDATFDLYIEITPREPDTDTNGDTNQGNTNQDNNTSGDDAATALRDAECDAVEFGSTIVGNIDDSVPSVGFCFYGRSGDYYSVEMFTTSGDLDTYLIITDGNGSIVGENDDAGPDTLNSFIGVEISQNGVYFIDATRWDGTGQFNLIVLEGRG